MRRFIAIACHLIVLALAFFCTDSRGEFFLIAIGLAIALDRYILKSISWPLPNLKTEALLRFGSFAAGSTFFYFLRPGIVPIGEAAYRGVMVCLAMIILERVVAVIGRASRSRVVAIGSVGAFLVLIAPIVVFLHPLRTVPKRAPESPGMSCEDIRFKTCDQVELAAWVIPHDQARGNIIYCHGHGRSRGQGAGLYPLFHSLGLNVLAFDFRGHGDSEGHVSTFGDREVDDLRAAVEYVRERFPDQPLFIAGISMGAAVTLQALPTLGHVDGVWCEGAFARFDDEVEHEFNWMPRAIRFPLKNLYYALGWLDCGFWGADVSPIDRLTGVEVPIYFCHGQRDELVPLREGQLLYDRYRGPKQCWWVEGASHYNVRQRNQEEYKRTLAEFVESNLPKS